jgi:GR25 family glycosyltransferase involved in LPS biosynthesis
MGFNRYFENIFCINLEKRKDRWDSFTKEMKKNSITGVVKYKGIDGGEIYNPTRMLNGELGILLTHLSLIKECKNRNYENVLIFEDDLVLHENYNNLDDYMSQVPNDWDFIYFGGNHVYGDKPEKINDNTLKLNYTVSLHCVAIKNTMFDIIIDKLNKFEKQVDACYADLHKSVNCYGITPNIALQKEGFSNIQNKIVNYNNFFNS